MKLAAEKLKTMPQQPGIYLFKNAAGKILYVGKAKSLRSRVRSYFRPAAALDPAKQQMVRHIADLDTITTDTETEALILEANLIRRHQPPYNVVLRDDKYYLFIKITTSEAYPRVYAVRRMSGQARYFGPYSSAGAVRHTLKLLRRIFPHRGEKDDPREKIFPHPLFTPPPAAGDAAGRSPAPSVIPRGPARSAGEAELSEAAGGGPRRQDPPEHYQLNIANAIRFLKGDRRAIARTLRAGMRAAAARQQFERAAIFRDQLRAVERLEGTQKVHLARRASFDVVSIARAPSRSAANVFQIRQGKLLGKNTFLLKHRAPAAPRDVVRQFILQYYSEARDLPSNIYLPLALTDAPLIAGFLSPRHPPRFALPQRGTRRQLQMLGERNAAQLLSEEQQRASTPSASRAAVAELFRAISLPRPHRRTRIETFDISNIQGQLATGSMVVYVDGLPAKDQYRKFRIKTGEGQPDDVRMLAEVLTRRLSHYPGAPQERARWPLPDLMVIDGGLGQLAVTERALQAAGRHIPLAALAKRQEELFITGQHRPIRLPYDSPALHLLQRMRDEAHRFGLSYHRLLRSRRGARSFLDAIPGIGPQSKRRLLTRFGSLKAIRAAETKDVAKIIGPSRAKTLRDYL